MPEQPTILRHWLLLRSLGARRQGATLRDLADENGVSQKTILRDLELLRRLGFQLVYEAGDHGRKHWRLAGGGGLPQLSFTLEEAAALYLGRQFLEPLAGTDFFHGAQSAFAKIRSTLGDAPLRHLEKLAAAFYCKTHGLADYSAKGQLIDDLQRAVEDRRLTVIAYQSLRATEAVTHYDVHPYALVWHNHALYLLAHSAGHGQIRTFKVDRLSKVEIFGLQFPAPANFDPLALLAGSLGVFQGDGPLETVRIRFSPTVSRSVAERAHHPSQRLTKQPDGSLLAEFELSDFHELTSWLLSWGQHAEVLSPPHLRQQVAATLQAALAAYQESGARSQEPAPKAATTGRAVGNALRGVPPVHDAASVVPRRPKRQRQKPNPKPR